MANKLTAENIEAAAQHLENIQDRYRHPFLMALTDTVEDAEHNRIYLTLVIR